ncbi:MAG: tRNA (N(6)-L-threonylcarbamoyladenosine(37)-C(2))-methylthiotransferase MtaB [Sporomusaceae bacterium]|nr:tRNA (N(6)-L-threonylcarbamoyladenosine(37)-C(2))-methylthiotransferase MtaB [Sporomusaceae bacterium]
MRKVAFTTLGCKVNQFETETMEGLFKARGYEVVAFDRPADVYVVNTCSVTHLGERKSRQLIRRATRTSPGATVVVTGCYAQVSPGEVEAIPGVDVIVGTQDRQRIVDLTEEAADSHRQIRAVGDIMAADEFEDIPLFAAPGRTRAFLKIQEGCANFCTYCIIPYARGPLRSRSLASIEREAAKFVAAGFREIVLTGIHLGAYGQDAGGAATLTDAVRTVLAVPGVARLRLGSLESIEVSDALIAVMLRDERFCPHLHLPLQAGDDAVLAAMNRHYATAEYRDLVRGIQERVPDIAITTDIIVGFPGETDEQFANTLAFAAGMDFARIHVFPYSRRQGTPAAEFPGQVSEAEKKRRAAALQDLADRQAAAFHARFVGRELKVLFEPAADGGVEGLTGNYMRVYTDGARSLAREIRPVRLVRLHKDGLWGEIVG